MQIREALVRLVVTAVGVSTGLGVIAAAGPAVPTALSILDAGNTATGRLPDGWRLKVKRGIADLAVIGEGDNRAIRFRSRGSSFAIERAVDVDINRYPVLAWNWKVRELPAGGDFRHNSTDDQAAQVLVVFADHRILSYIWDTSAPKGLFQSASSLPLLHIYALVCQSGPEGLNRWSPEAHNLMQDYQRAYDGPAPGVKGIRLQINTQHTDGSAESYFGNLTFQAAH